MKSVLCSLQLLAVLSRLVDAQFPPSGPKPKGLKISWVGHSFHVYLPSPVSKLATEAGITGHTSLGVDFIGASQPCQHWTKGGGEEGTNAVKNILKAAKADVQTLSLQQPNPDPCIPKFAKLAHQYKKDMRIMVQITWLPNSANAEEQCQLWGCNNRDAATFEGLQKSLDTIEKPFTDRIRYQLDGLNRDFGSNFTVLVPIWEAVLKMRQLIVKGQLPGVTKQSSLFVDSLGHPQPPMVHMTSYLWFAALYGMNPAGSKSLGGSAAQSAVLQKLAWDVFTKEPLNGFNTVPGETKAYPKLPEGSKPPPAGKPGPGFPGGPPGGGKSKAAPTAPKAPKPAGGKGEERLLEARTVLV